MGVTLAWLFGEGIITWRWVKNGAPPTPGALIMSSGFFALCALLGADSVQLCIKIEIFGDAQILV